MQVLDYVGKFYKLRLLLLKTIYALVMGHRPEIEYGKFHGFLQLGAYILPAVGRHIQLAKLSWAFDFMAQVEGKVSDCIYCRMQDRRIQSFGEQYLMQGTFKEIGKLRFGTGCFLCQMGMILF